MTVLAVGVVLLSLDSDICSEMGVQGALSPAGVRGVPAFSPSPPSGLQARQHNSEQMSALTILTTVP